MNRASLLCLLILGCRTSQADDPRVLAPVRTWAELAGRPSIELPDGVRVRLGVDRTTAPRFGGIHLYCLSEGFTPPRKWSGTALGPLSVEVRWAGVAPSDESLSMRQEREGEPDRDPRLFLLLVPLRYEGPVTLILRGTEGLEIARAEIRVVPPALPPWMPWAPPEAAQELVPKDPADPVDAAGYVANPAAGIALPYWCGLSGIAGESLPHLLPESPKSGFRLRRDRRGLRIESDEEFEIWRPDYHFLSRWWVDGRPFMPEPDRDYASENGVHMTGRSLQIIMEFHPSRLGARSGSRVGLQLLYCQDGWQFLSWPGLKAGHLPRPAVWMTNRIDWEVP